MYPFVQPAHAQRATAAIAGSIIDSSKAAVPAATVAVRNLDTGVEQSVKSNGLGFYVVPSLPAGPYSVTVTKEGFETQTVPRRVLEVDRRASINRSAPSPRR